MSAASRLARADTRIEKPKPEKPKTEKPRGADGKFVPAPLAADFVCPECLHTYWWAGSICTGVLDAEGLMTNHAAVRVEPIAVKS